MGKSLAEYAAQQGQADLPEPDRAQLEASALSVKDRAQRAAEAARLKESIMQQLEGGAEPQNILYTALKCIGGLTDDPDFTAETTGILGRIYSDLAQQSFIMDNAAIAAARLEQQQADYIGKLKKTMNQKKAGLLRIERDINALLQQLDGLQAEGE